MVGEDLHVCVVYMRVRMRVFVCARTCDRACMCLYVRSDIIVCTTTPVYAIKIITS